MPCYHFVLIIIEVFATCMVRSVGRILGTEFKYTIVLCVSAI